LNQSVEVGEVLRLNGIKNQGKKRNVALKRYF